MSTIASVCSLPPLPRAIRLCWSSQSSPSSANGRRRFVLDVDLVSSNRAMVEAWVETGEARRLVLARQPMAIDLVADDQLLHIDILGHNGDGRLAALSIPAREQVHPGHRPLYAQTPLLSAAGFAAGSYDRPTLFTKRDATAAEDGPAPSLIQSPSTSSAQRCNQCAP